MQTSEQVKEYMLCEPCEERFSAFETYVAPLVRQLDGTSGLEAMLRNFEGTQYGWRTAEATALDRDKVFYFAASVFWRSHASRFVDRCELGDKYGEAFRAFLSKETDTIPDTAISLMIYESVTGTGGRIDRAFTFPTSRRAGHYHLHQFVMCGLRLDAAVGGCIPESRRAGCLTRPQETRILVVPQDDDRPGVDALVQANRPTERLAATLLK